MTYLRHHRFLIAAVSVPLLLGPPVVALGADESPRPGPVKGVFVKGFVLSCSQKECDVFVCIAPVKGRKDSKDLRCSFQGPFYVRWHVGAGSFWVSRSSSVFQMRARDLAHESLARYDLAALLTGKFLPDRDIEYGDSRPGDETVCTDPVVETRWYSSTFKAATYFDWLPGGENDLRVLLLTNLSWHTRTIKRDGKDALEHYQTKEDLATPHWSMTSYRYRGKWEAAEKFWDNRESKWTTEEEIDVAFEEPFQLLTKGETLYFLTASGRLFAAPTAAKGKRRAMKPVWDDKARPVTALIVDADADRTFLFCAPKKDCDQGLYFELNLKATPLAYDPAKLPDPKGENSDRKVVRLTRFLIAEGKISNK